MSVENKRRLPVRWLAGAARAIRPDGVRSRRANLRRRVGLPLAGATALFLTALSPAWGGQVPAGHASGAPITEVHCTFVDSSRSVPDYATRPPSIASKVRVLSTTLWLPPPGAPRPERALILFASGYDSYPDVYAPLLTAWARAGFVVAAPTFPDENPEAVAAQGTNTEGDLGNEPADLAYVGHALEQASLRHSSGCPAVFGRVDPHAVVIAGHSDGATAAALFAFGTGSDPQGVTLSRLRSGFSLRGALIFSGAEDGFGPYGAPDPRLPLLMVQSAGDHCNPERDAVALYRDTAVRERFFLLLRSAQHRSPFDGTDQAAFALVSATSTRFLRLAVRGTSIGAGFIAYADRHPTIGAIYSTPPVTAVLPPSCAPT